MPDPMTPQELKRLAPKTCEGCGESVWWDTSSPVVCEACRSRNVPELRAVAEVAQTVDDWLRADGYDQEPDPSSKFPIQRFRAALAALAKLEEMSQ